MRIPKAVYVLFAVALLAGMLPMAVAADRAPIEQELLDKFAAEGQANFFVKMAVDADLSAAYGMDWEARGQYVWNALNEVAAQTQAPVIAYAQKHGLDYTSMLTTNSVFIRGGTLDAAQGLAALPGVAYLRLERILAIPDPLVGAPGINGFAGESVAPEATTDWGITDTKADQVWQLGVRGLGIRIANIDTGVQWDHPALVNQFACPGDPSNPDCWADPSNICGGSACDNVGHGTHTMGTMVAIDDPNLPYIAGMAPDASWIACKGCESNSCSEYALNTCADWVVAPNGNPDCRPHVVNNSWGGGGGDDWYLVKVNAWRAAGIYPAFSAGNSGPGCGTLGSPGDYQESVASAAHASNRVIASFSSRGPSAFGHDPYTKPNISAPGVSICSTVPTNGWNCGYSGTSMASPHTAGTVALIWSGCPDFLGQIDLTTELIQDWADVAPDGNCGAPPDGEGNYTYGYGYLNALAAVMGCIGGVEFGTLEGHVYDEYGNPIEGAAVIAQPAAEGTIEAVTDPNGFYTMQLVPGLYNVTASKYGFESQTAYGVEILADEITVQDFSLTSVPVWLPGDDSLFDLYRFDAAYNPHDGLIYILGGRSDSAAHDKSIWTYDPATGVSADTGIDMLYNASNYTIALIDDDGTGRGEAMYVMGGYDVNAATNIDKVQRFYPQTGEVEDVATDPYPDVSPGGYVIGAGGVGVVDGKVYVFGGWESTTPYFSNKTFVYDPLAPAGSRWTNLGCTLNPARGYINSAVSEGKIYALGGHYSYAGSDLAPTDVAEVFDTADPGACWQAIANMPVATAEGRGFGFDADTKNDYGKLYVVGGGDWPDQSAEVLEYDIATDTWDDTFPEIAQARRNHAGAYVSDCTPDPDDAFPSMWIFGGRISADNPPYGDPEYYPLPCGAENTMHVNAIEGMLTLDPYGRTILRARTQGVDQDGSPLEGVWMSVTIMYPAGEAQRGRYTKPSGWARFHWGTPLEGAWELCVDNMELDGYTYNPDDNVITCRVWD